MEPYDVQISAMQPIATAFFVAAVIHTFACGYINALARRMPEGSLGENFLHFAGEVEVVFGLWAAALVAVWAARFGTAPAVAYVESVNYTEAVFVFVIMTMAATRPVLYAAGIAIRAIGRFVPAPPAMGLFVATMIVGPLLGSLITEPAAMTVTALLLRDQVFRADTSSRLKYAALGLLFVNISIGGTLTHFAAPPVLMVATAWHWSTPFMMAHFGWKAVISVILGTVGTAFAFRKQLMSLPPPSARGDEWAPFWMVIVHVLFMTLTIINSHHLSFIMALFLFFIGWSSVSREHQDSLRVRESLLVGFFLGGLVTLGKLQDWWLQPLLSDLGPTPLFWGSLALTSVTDNAAITYLGTLVPSLTEVARYMLVAGAVVGGGLTVIANAPNPAGYGILSPTFGEDGISPMRLLLGALPFTLLAAALFLLL